MVGIVWVTYDRKNVLADLLDPLEPQSGMHEHRYAIDNASRGHLKVCRDSLSVWKRWQKSPAERMRLISTAGAPDTLLTSCETDVRVNKRQ